MSTPAGRAIRTDAAILAALALFPAADAALGLRLTPEMPKMFVYAILAIGLHVVVGAAGILHLGMAAFFAIGAYTAGILTVKIFPFQVGFWGALFAGPLAAAAAGVLLGLPVLRLRGDYIAIVTLGFGEMVQVALKNLYDITRGPQGLNPIPPPALLGIPFSAPDRIAWYFFALALLAAGFAICRRLESGSLGLAWRAIREDELAAGAIGIPTNRAKLAAFGIGAAYAGAAGVLYASYLRTTADPSTYDFTLSVMVLAMVILGGLGNLRGALAGVMILQGFDSVLAPRVTEALARGFPDAKGNAFLTFSNWRWLVFGVVLVLLMRFRSGGLLPAGAGGGRRDAGRAREGG